MYKIYICGKITVILMFHRWNSTQSLSNPRQRSRSLPRWRRGNNRGGFNRGGRGRFQSGVKITKEALDAELDSYMANTKTVLDRDLDDYMEQGKL